MSKTIILLFIAAAGGYFTRWTSPATLPMTLFSAGTVFFVFFIIIAHKQTAIMLCIAVLLGILLAEVLVKKQPHRRR